ncbi:MAG: pyrroline-5-carboxylate reductase [Acidobacteriota bacterium]|nr:pyrroline-5-carboxylate reductase [Blastocatellia bacterium]MDW8411282.1 pyrroline-5-carboxylate reductase [Acidobacteriota bacterium]
MLEDKKIAIIGSGTMGQAIVGGLLRSGIPAARLKSTARTRSTSEKISEQFGIECSIHNDEVVRWADITILCVKPKDVEKVCIDLKKKEALVHNPLLISIAAGISTGFIENIVGSDTPVLRAMPNTPCFIGKGMTVVSKGANATDEHVEIARAIFSPLGRFIELEEKHMDTVTGLSASGPAFIYVIIEALADGGVMRGLPRNVATELVAQMTLGAAAMVLATGKHPAALKDDVTTPAGCTIAGILALEDGRIRSVLARGVETAAKVAAELGK